MARVPFVDAVFILFLCLCPAQSGPTELYISTDPNGLGPLFQPHSPHSASAGGGGGTFQEVQSLKIINKREKKLLKETKKYTRKREKATFQDSQSVLQHTSKNHYCLFL